MSESRYNMAAPRSARIRSLGISSVQLYTNEVQEIVEESLMILPVKEAKSEIKWKNQQEGDADSKHDNEFRNKRQISMLHTPSVMTYYSDYLRTPQIVAMVGLPARGKTYISKKLCRYLNWIGFKTKVFNFGDYRRINTTYLDHNIFNKNSIEGKAILENSAQEAMTDAQQWISDNEGEIAILDATNSTLERRKKIQNFAEDNGYKLFFIESICTDNKIVDSNIREVKLKSPDYEGREPKEIMDDFLQRIEHYVENYVPLNDIAEPDIRYIKLINAGESIEIVRHEGPVQSRIIYYLMSLQLLPRDIYLTRAPEDVLRDERPRAELLICNKHGESECNIHNIIGGDCDISPQGEKYADALFEFFENMNIPDLRVFTSRLKRTIQTAKRFTCIQERWEALNEINVGICDGMTINEINEKYPELFDNRYNNKFHFRYPDGESYQDVIGRLETVIMELERESNILVVTHAAIIRCLLGYFLDIPSEEIPYIYVPLHTLFKLSPITYGCTVQHVRFPIKGTSTEIDHKINNEKCQCVYTIKD